MAEKKLKVVRDNVLEPTLRKHVAPKRPANDVFPDWKPTKAERSTKEYRDWLIAREVHMVRRWQSGESTSSIAKDIGCSEGRVNKAIVSFLQDTTEWKALSR